MTQFIPAQPYFQHEIEVRHSRFITHVGHCSTPDEALAFRQQISAEHAKANHNCWAQIAGNRDDLNCWGSNDDGEPKGTAGKPMLNVLSHSQLCEVAVVVTRYFGGIKLGAGGLVRAYSQAVQEALQQLECEEKIETYPFSLSLPHSLVGDIEQMLSSCQVEVEERNWSEQLSITGRGSSSNLERLREQLNPLQHLTGYKDHKIRW